MPSVSRSPDHARALLMLLLANLFWGVSFPVIKSLGLLHARLIPDSGSWFSTFYSIAPRFLLALLLLVVWQGRGFWRARWLEVKQGVIIGLFAAGGMLFQVDGLQFTAASTSAFLTQFYAIMIPIYLAVRTRRRPPPVVWVSCAAVLAGVAILGQFDWRQLSFGRGEWETLLCSVFFMGQILWLEKPEFATNRVPKLTLVMFATEAAVFWLLAGFSAPDAATLLIPWTSPGWLGLTATLTVFCTLGAFLLMNTWQPKITATEAGLIYCVEPIFGSALALFLPGLISVWIGISYPNETATSALLIGGGLITVANILIQLSPPAVPVPPAGPSTAP